MIRPVHALCLTTLTLGALLIARPALAGPPLLCFPFDIGQARSLPMGHGGWNAIDPTYDSSRLVDDTLALLDPTTPVVVRMETIRRATVYASKDPKSAALLLRRLQDRASIANAGVGGAVFDFGYLVETYRQATFAFKEALPAINAIDGYQLVLKAIALQGDPSMEFAAAVMTQGNTRTTTESREHLRRAHAAAGTNPALATNLAKHFQSGSQ